MDSNTAMKFIAEYTSRIERIRYVENMIKSQEDVVKSAQKYLDHLHAELAKETAYRNDAHAFALSAIKSLTPQRGFTV